MSVALYHAYEISFRSRRLPICAISVICGEIFEGGGIDPRVRAHFSRRRKAAIGPPLVGAFVLPQAGHGQAIKDNCRPAKCRPFTSPRVSDDPMSRSPDGISRRRSRLKSCTVLDNPTGEENQAETTKFILHGFSYLERAVLAPSQAFHASGRRAADERRCKNAAAGRLVAVGQAFRPDFAPGERAVSTAQTDFWMATGFEFTIAPVPLKQVLSPEPSAGLGFGMTRSRGRPSGW